MNKTLLAATCLIVSSAVHAQTWNCGESIEGNHGQILSRAAVASEDQAGFDFNMPPEQIDKSGCSSLNAFFFSAPEHEGNYLVTVVLGGSQAALTTVKAEARRLMLLNVATSPGEHRTERFVVNVRQPSIGPDDAVKRKPREMNSLDWDDKLTLEFSGQHPSLQSITIEPAPSNTPTVYLAGDSTVVDQDKEPWAAWGQMLPVFFGAKVAIADHAESGETIGSFESERRFAKIFSVIKPGDYLFMQFAHNDQKPGRGYISPDRYTEMLRKYIDLARQKHATPVLVTSMNRRTFDSSGHITDSLAPYPETMRKVAGERKVALIDLNSMSRTLYQAIGEPHSTELFVYAPANTYPGQTEALHDDTHFNNFGAFELAKCIVRGIEQDKLPLARLLRKPAVHFDPAHPDPVSSIKIPPSPFTQEEKPYER